MKKLVNSKKSILFFIFIFAIISVYIAFNCNNIVRDTLYNEKIEAAHIMQKSMDLIKERKHELGLALDPLDIHETGMIGEQYTPITTTLGSIEAKRTSANPDMAALVVHLLGQLKLKQGDTIGANFSGSFPAFNIAVLSACEALDLEIVYISSIGSSNYGANQVDLTFPDMVNYLVKKGVFKTNCSLVSPGGEDDAGSYMDKETLDTIIDRMKVYGFDLLIEPDFEKNIKRRLQVLDEREVNAFISVGGNISSMGIGEYSSPLGEGIVTSTGKINDDSGLIEIFSSWNIPTINIINIKRFVSRYGLPFDPSTIGEIGESSIYYKVKYPFGIIIFSLVMILILLIYLRKWNDCYEDKNRNI